MIYKFISKKLVFAYDSVNILIPQIHNLPSTAFDLIHLTDLAIQGMDNFEELNQFIFNIFCLTKKDIEVILENK